MTGYVPIKFRGKRLDNDEFAYGYLVQSMFSTKIVNREGEYRVDEETVSRLAGYDSEGNEVYQRSFIQ